MTTEAPRRRLRAIRTAEPIVCDGLLDDPAWNHAETFRDWSDPWNTEHHPLELTVRVLYDEMRLYVAFTSRDTDVVCRQSVRQGPVCNDSCVEMFISPFLDEPGRYFTFEINAIGTMLNYRNDLRAGNNIREPWVPAGFRIGHSLTGTSLDQEGECTWCVEFAVPFSQFVTADGEGHVPKAGDVWRVNFMRCGGRTWQPLLMFNPAQSAKPNFHQPQYFGELEFAGS